MTDCIKAATCPEVQMLLDKELADGYEYGDFIEPMCKKCPEFEAEVKK